MEMQQWIYVEKLYTASGNERMIVNIPTELRRGNNIQLYLKSIFSIVKFLFL